jgi:predicted phage terminase large subunit-like protein
MLSADVIAECRTDLLAFTKTIFKARKNIDFIENWHHAKICAALERVFIGETKRLIINIPPRYSKTEIAVLNFISWAMGNIPDCEFIHASYSKRLATNNTWGARSIMTHETYAEIFGWPQFRQDSNAKDEYRTVQGGCVYATGSEGTITGYGAGKMRDYFGGAIIIDDPHKAGEAASDVMRKNVIDWFHNTVESRVNSPETPIIIIMQRLHEEDLSGYLLGGGNGEHWEHLNIPVLNEDDEPLWEYKHTREKLKEMESSNPYVFAGQYMQSPSPMGGGMFKEEYFKYYDILPPDIYQVRIYGDTAQKTKEHNDYSVFQCWGKSRSGGLYLIDQVRGKWEAPELERVLISFWLKHKKSGAQVVKVEDKSSGSSLIQSIKRQQQIPIDGIQRNTDKVTRAFGAVPYFASGYVYLPADAEWLHDYKEELKRFTPMMTHKHDDQLDPTIDAIDDMLVTPSYNLNAFRA